MKKALLLGLVCVALSGCNVVASTNPIYHNRDLVFIPELVGCWSSPAHDDEFCLVSRGEGKKYLAVVKKADGEESGRFTFALTRIGTSLFADTPDDEGNAGAAAKDKKEKPRHFIALLQIADKDHVRLALPEPEGMVALLQADPKALRHEMESSQSVQLTDSTRHLRKFFKKHLEAGDLRFTEMEELTRKTDAACCAEKPAAASTSRILAPAPSETK